SHVLEHVYDPSGLLSECYRLLKPGGHLRVVVPNPKSWGHKLFGSRWRGLEPPRHLHLFTPEALRMLSERAGFETRIASLAQGATYFYKHSNLQGSRRPNFVRRLWTNVKSFVFGLAESIILLRFKDAGE